LQKCKEESTKRYIKKNADNAKEYILHSNFNLRVLFLVSGDENRYTKFLIFS